MSDKLQFVVEPHETQPASLSLPRPSDRLKEPLIKSSTRNVCMSLARSFRVCIKKDDLFTPKAFNNSAQGNTLGLGGVSNPT